MQKSSLNKVILIGRIGDKPEGRYTPNGTSTTSFPLATNEVWGTGENRKEHTEWHNIIAWDKLADFVSDYVYKGQQICIEGRIKSRTWKDKADNTRKVTEIIAESITPLEWKSKSTPGKKATSDKDEDVEELPY